MSPAVPSVPLEFRSIPTRSSPPRGEQFLTYFAGWSWITNQVQEDDRTFNHRAIISPSKSHMAPKQQTVSAQKSGWRLEPRAAALERFLERHQIWILAIWTVVYFAGTMLRAKGKPFWYDEILTLLEARQPSLSAAMSAVGDADWMPPANHLTFYLTNQLVGHGEVAFRIPPMIAFWVFCICLYFFARRRVSIFFALTAMLLPYASAFQSYSYEARGYAFMLGFCGIALVSWQAAAEGIRRPWSLLGLAVGIAGAISFQYWAVLIYLPLAGAEAYRSIRLRRVDWSIWAAFTVGGLALVASLYSVLHGLRTWSPGVGMRALPTDFLHFYKIGFRVYFTFAIPAALLLAAWFVAGGRKEKLKGDRQAAIPDHEWVAAVILLLLIPVTVVSIALAVPPHAFATRYAAPAVAGYALLGAFLAARLAGGRSSIGLICVLAALTPFTYLMTHPRHFENPVQRMRGLKQRIQSGPVVIEDLIQYLQLWYYAPEPLKPRLLFLAAENPNGFGGPFAEFSKLGVPLVRYDDFARPGTDFLFYEDVGGQSKLRERIVGRGGTVETIELSRRRVLMLAHVK